MLRKGLLSVAVALPMAGALIPAQAQTLEQLREQCFAHRNNRQMKAFNIKLLCNVEYTDVEKHQGEIVLSNKLWSSSQITMKGWQTQENITRGNGPSQTEHCTVYDKVRIKGPEGGVPVTVTACEDLNEEYVTRMCKDVTKEICDSSTIVSQQQYGEQGYEQQGAQCVKEVIGAINTCDNYEK